MRSCYTCRTKPEFWLAICPVFDSRATTEPVLLLRCEGLLTWHGVLSFPGAQRVRGQPRDALLPYHAPQPRQTVPHLGRGRDDRRPRQHQLKGHGGACWERWVLQESPRRRRRVKRGCVKVMREISCTPVTFIPPPSPLCLLFLAIDWQLWYWLSRRYVARNAVVNYVVMNRGYLVKWPPGREEVGRDQSKGGSMEKK